MDDTSFTDQEITESFLLTRRFKSPVEFSKHIEERVVSEKIGYIDAVIDYCSINGIDIESIGNLISTSLKEKIQLEAENSNMLKPRGKLPL